ncbi:WD40/YVTN/BNR-like repeat-containing protein [Pseudomonas sp. GCM10022188]|uniref:WD40/YVTN/BNR-like repeat-containing protein n=1 Tax=Pseudomonas TaxID=286 RepID=UPI001E497421|nr:YCF48-related protein [Pseudomonas oryzagri]MCC6076061.1 YCF48-related protein [Pseudomonas oryzagri]
MKRLLLVSAALLYGLGVAADDASVVSPKANPLSTPSLQAPLAAQAVMLSIAQAGARNIAVGERGIAVYSDDGGKNWQQASVPVSVTLTGVSFPSSESGWAIGHAGVVLHSIDGGRSWLKQIDGVELAKLELSAAQSSGDERRVRLAKQLVSDGPDKPLLAVHFWDEHRGVVLGAYGLIFGTEDGGKSWTSWMGRLENPMGMHLNAISVNGNRIFIAGEQGLLLRSTDSGASFELLEPGYNGSWFAVTQSAEHVVLAGLRGTVYASTDGGDSWSESVVPAPVTILSAVRVPDGRIIYANQAGQLLSSQNDGKHLQLETRSIGMPLSSLGLGQGGDLLATSFSGVVRLPLSRQSSVNQ